MNAYICVTYAQNDRDANDGFCRALSRYGFRYQCIHENSDPVKRNGILTESALLIALTSAAADRAETVGADIRRALERKMTVLCISLEENPLDGRFCAGTESGAIRIPYPVGKTPDRHSVALFIHRLFVRHLARYEACFVESRCAEDLYGSIVSLAHRAHNGDGASCYALGRAYDMGEGLPNLENEAAIWLERAAQADVPDALIRMGILCLQGKGTERSPETAFRLFSRAALLGDRRGDYRRGLCYLKGLGVVRDPEEGVACLRRAVQEGYGPALYRLGCLCRDGEGTPRDGKTARDLLYAAVRRLAFEEGETCIPMYGRPTRRYVCVSMRHMRRHTLQRLLKDALSEKRDADPMRSFSRCMGSNEYEIVSLPEDVFGAELAALHRGDEGDHIHKKAGKKLSAPGAREADEPTLVEISLALGQLLAAGDEACGLRAAPSAALRWYRYALRMGSEEAAYLLGDAYRRGRGVPTIPHRAVALYRLAADWGSLRGRFAYAVCCEQGVGVPEDPFTAAAYYERAAEEGYAPAQNNLGGCYEMGRGVMKNDLLAVEWYSRAAEAGLADAQCRLGICYETGRGVAPDGDRAFRLYEAAASCGHAYALFRLGLFYHRRDCKRNEPAPASATVKPVVGMGAEDAEGIVASALDRDGASGGDPVEKILEEETLLGVSDRLEALSYYRLAVEAGSPDAAYALYVCYRHSYGVSRDPVKEAEYLRLAARRNYPQAIYELGVCLLDGRNMLCNLQAAVACFKRVVKLWETYGRTSPWNAGGEEWHALPPHAMPLRRAVGGSLYMLGYCALYGWDSEGAQTSTDQRPSSDRVKAAVGYLEEAVKLNHVGAHTLLGDLCAYHLHAVSINPEADALGYYERAEQARSSEGVSDVASWDPTHHGVDALLALAKGSLRTAAEDGDEGRAHMTRVSAWHTFSVAAELGSADALVGMAECLYRGWGESRNVMSAQWKLRQAMASDGGRVEAALCLGDILCSSYEMETDTGEIRRVPSASDLQEADAVYLQGLECPRVESECGRYTLGLRRADRLKADQTARTEVCYHVAVLRAVHFHGKEDHRESFPYLAKAVVQGHPAALDDLSRMYHHMIADATAPREEETAAAGFSLSSLLVGGKRLIRASRARESALSRSSRATLMHRTWMSDYYMALCPEPIPFAGKLHTQAVSGDIPEFATIPVTPLMRVNALCYLGECFFDGRGIEPDPHAAVTCFRAAVNQPLPAERGKPMPVALVNALYSLGWCRLYGVGTDVNSAEAVKLLNRVAKVHSGASYTLGICHEEGRGVVIPDPREALKHYRRAHVLGHTKAAEDIARLEKLLSSRANGT